MSNRMYHQFCLFCCIICCTWLKNKLNLSSNDWFNCSNFSSTTFNTFVEDELSVTFCKQSASFAEESASIFQVFAASFHSSSSKRHFCFSWLSWLCFKLSFLLHLLCIKKRQVLLPVTVTLGIPQMKFQQHGHNFNTPPFLGAILLCI